MAAWGRTAARMCSRAARSRASPGGVREAVGGGLSPAPEVSREQTRAKNSEGEGS